MLYIPCCREALQYCDLSMCLSHVVGQWTRPRFYCPSFMVILHLKVLLINSINSQSDVFLSCLLCLGIPIKSVIHWSLFIAMVKKIYFDLDSLAQFCSDLILNHNFCLSNLNWVFWLFWYNLDFIRFDNCCIEL
jgi:hypothetical protein